MLGATVQNLVAWRSVDRVSSLLEHSRNSRKLNTMIILRPLLFYIDIFTHKERRGNVTL